MDNIEGMPSPDEAMSNINSNIARDVQRSKSLDLLERLTNKIKARSLWNKYGLNELLQIKETLCEAIEKAEIEDLELQEIEKKKEEARQQVKEMLYSMGMTLADIIGDSPIKGPIRKKRKTGTPRGDVPMKYKCHELGRDWYWNGNNNTPTIFKFAFKKNGKPKRKFMMDEADWFKTSDEAMRDLTIPPEHKEEIEEIVGPLIWPVKK